MKILVTCPPMIGTQDQFTPVLESYGLEVYCPEMTQVLSEEELLELVPQFDGWIIGDDPATARVFEAGRAGNLKAAVKWGVGVDNVDFGSCNRLEIPIANTPGMFGAEVADMALGYVIALARETVYIDREIRAGNWPKIRGISLKGKKAGIIGLGDIGYNIALRLPSLGIDLLAYVREDEEKKAAEIDSAEWPERIEECDFLIFACSLNSENRHMLNKDVLSKCKEGVRIINVARGPLINEADLYEALKSNRVHSVALDVFEEEPLSMASPLREFPLCIFGSHNSSNTKEAVQKTNEVAINKLLEFLGLSK